MTAQGLDMSDSSSSGGGIGVLGAVFLIFLTLKLTETGPVAAWSWWWITAPLWGGIAVALAVAMCWIAVVATGHAIAAVSGQRKWKKLL